MGHYHGTALRLDTGLVAEPAGCGMRGGVQNREPCDGYLWVKVPRETIARSFSARGSA